MSDKRTLAHTLLDDADNAPDDFRKGFFAGFFAGATALILLAFIAKWFIVP